MTPIPARVFGPGVASTGTPAELTVCGDQLEVRSSESSARARMSDVCIRAVGFGRQMGFELAWDDAEGARAVQVLDPEAVRQLLAIPLVAASPQMQSLKTAARRGSLVRSVGWFALIALLLLPAVLIAVFVWQADRIAGALAERIPLREEIALGEQAYAGMQPSLQLIDSGPAYDAVVALGQRLSHGSRYRYRFHVAQDDAINAFALPGGIIVVHTGLIAASRRAEELAGVLAHEIQHVEQRHSLRAAFKQLGMRGLWALVTGDLGSTLIGQAALQLTSLTFSRSDERSADAKGLDELVARGIDPQGMIDFFATMAKRSEVDPPAFLSSHPTGPERRQALLDRLTLVDERTYAPLQMGTWPPATR